MQDSLALLGFASGIAGNNPDCALGPWYLYYHPEWLQHLSTTVTWHDITKLTSISRGADVLPELETGMQALSKAVLTVIQAKQAFCVIGGDHSCAIGTWSAVSHAHREAGDIGLLWIDAHMDSHTPDTSMTQNMHGMPLAVLLGHGVPSLCHLLDAHPKLKPQNVCLVGIRSYELGEQQLLERLGVRIYYMNDVQKRGLTPILQEASEHLAAQTCGFGITIDMDAIDPSDAPGVGYREPDGLDGQQLLSALRHMPHKERLLGLELTEYNPIRDIDNKTAHLLIGLIQAVFD